MGGIPSVVDEVVATAERVKQLEMGKGFQVFDIMLTRKREEMHQGWECSKNLILKREQQGEQSI